MTSGTLKAKGTKSEVRTDGGQSEEWEQARGSDTYRGAGFAIRTGTAGASSQTLKGSREVWAGSGRKVMEEEREWKLG